MRLARLYRLGGREMGEEVNESPADTVPGGIFEEMTLESHLQGRQDQQVCRDPSCQLVSSHRCSIGCFG